MRVARLLTDLGPTLAAVVDGSARGLPSSDDRYPGDLIDLIESGPTAIDEAYRRLREAPPIDLSRARWLPPVPGTGKILCVGKNYRAHAEEMGSAAPGSPMVFARFASSLVGHEAPMIRPRASHQFDYEGELAVVIGRGGRHIRRAQALDWVAGYALFNDGSVRDYQARTTQFTLGKNFDGTGAFGPMLVTPDELPPGAAGLWLETRVNGTVRQRASTDSMIFDIPTLIEAMSEVMTLEPGDVLVTGTPAGVGQARTPPVFLTPGDVVEVEATGLGVLRNRVVDED